ncbi:MAG: SIS domain-containing protein [Armatimonadetes bacterium]|nr:SIS domain-containing protein [Armatimonadota bacterium]
MGDFQESCELILSEVRSALAAVDPAQVEALIEALTSVDQVFVIGVGRVMLSVQAFAKRLCHLGIRAHVVGDITEPAITERDLLVVGSGSGESVVPVAIARVAHRHGARIAHIGSNPESTLAPLTSVFVRVPVQTKLSLRGEIASQQIMSSLFEQALYLLGDAVCLTLARRRNLEPKALWRFHANLE